jgi:hypothetical protein
VQTGNVSRMITGGASARRVSTGNISRSGGANRSHKSNNAQKRRKR